MNERIRQLANIWANRRAEDEKLGIVYTFSEPALEQFAELIVRECISVMKSTVAESIDFERKLDETSSWIESDIKKHFGVEE